MITHRTSMMAVSATTYGSKIQIPKCCARLPATQGRSAAPMLPRLAMKPIALGTMRLGSVSDISAMVVGKIGPRLKPVKNRAKAATGN